MTNCDQICYNMQVGELAGIAVGATVMLNILIAGYVRIPTYRLSTLVCLINQNFSLLKFM